MGKPSRRMVSLRKGLICFFMSGCTGDAHIIGRTPFTEKCEIASKLFGKISGISLESIANRPLEVVSGSAVLLRCPKGLVATVGCSGTVGGDNAKMIGRGSAQAADIRTGVLIGVPTKALIGCGQPVTCSSAVLEVNACGQAMGINCSVQCGQRTCHVRRGVRTDHWRPSCAQRGKGPIRAVSGAGAVRGHNPEMISGARS